MKNFPKSIVLGLILAIIFSSCKAYRNVENLKPKATEEAKAGPFDRTSLTKLVPGDKIKIVTTSGFTYQMTFKNWTGEHVRGTVTKVNSEKVLNVEVKEIPIEEIETLYVWRVSAGASSPFILLGAAGFAFGILILIYLSDPIYF